MRKPPRPTLLPTPPLLRSASAVEREVGEHLPDPRTELEPVPRTGRANHNARIFGVRPKDEVLARRRRVQAALERHPRRPGRRSEEHTSELQSRQYLVCRLL